MDEQRPGGALSFRKFEKFAKFSKFSMRSRMPSSKPFELPHHNKRENMCQKLYRTVFVVVNIALEHCIDWLIRTKLHTAWDFSRVPKK